MTATIVTRLRWGLVAQAALTGAGLAVSQLDAGHWLPLGLGATAGACLLAWFVGQTTRSAWTMTLLAELLCVALGGAGAAGGHYLPGCAVAVPVIVAMLLPSGRAAFAPAQPAYAAPVRLTPPPVVAAAPARPGPPGPPRAPTPPPPFAPPAPAGHGRHVTASTPPPPLTVPLTASSTAPLTAPLTAPMPPPPGWNGPILPG